MIAKGLRITKKYIDDLKWLMIDILWRFKSQPKTQEVSNQQFSIGVVTYVNRYEIHFLPLIKRLLAIFPDTQLIIAINGYYDSEVQKKYIADITNLLSSYDNVTFFSYDKGQSLSKLWNQIVIHSKKKKTFIFNDDIKISSCFRNSLEQSGIVEEGCGLVNSSWSHFLINRDIIKLNGWFDERFSGVGYEDQDYEIRLVNNDFLIKDFKVRGLKNIVFKTKDFSYGSNIDTDYEKYSSVNGKVFFKKWLISPTEKGGFKYVRIIQGYAKQVEGMETPNFYKEIEKR